MTAAEKKMELLRDILTPAEAVVFKELDAARGNIVSKQVFYEAMYQRGWPPPNADGVLKVMIFRVRQKLKQARIKDRAIEVVRGRGYRMEIIEQEQP
jgi:DNA-binding response OmpR family regulator